MEQVFVDVIAVYRCLSHSALPLEPFVWLRPFCVCRVCILFKFQKLSEIVIQKNQKTTEKRSHTVVEKLRVKVFYLVSFALHAQRAFLFSFWLCPRILRI